MEPETTVNEAALISRIQAGEILFNVSVETGVSMYRLNQLLRSNNINYDELLVQRRLHNLIAKREAFKKSGSYTLHADDAARKHFAYAMLSDMNHIWSTLNRRPLVSDVYLYGNFKEEDIRLIFPRVSYLIYLTACERANHNATFLPEAEVKEQHTIFNQKKVLVNHAENRTEKKKQILIRQLQQLEKELGRAPLKMEVYKNGIYMRCYRAFGSYKTALKEAGIKSAQELGKEETIANNKKMKEEKLQLLEQLKNLRAQLGREPLPEEVEQGVPYAQTRLAIYYPDFAAACRKAGILESYSFAGKFYTQKQMLEMLKNLSVTIGRVPDYRDINKHLPFSHMALYRRFGSVDNALVAAGVVDHDYFDKKYKQDNNKIKNVALNIQ